jgi:acyl-ACP thioesterase
LASNRYAKEYEIHYYQIDKEQKATALALVNLLEDTALSHSQAIGLGMEELKSKGIVWLLNSWNIIIDKYPKWHDRISIESWPSHRERFYATTESFIKDVNGVIIVRASILWILVSIERKRPIRIPLEFSELYGMELEKAIDYPFNRIEEVVAPEMEGNYLVRRSDIDTNQHVNNSRYIEWALEQVPAHIYEHYRLHSLEVKYKKEAMPGSRINSCCKTYIEEDERCVYLHSILSEDRNTEFAAAKTAWVKNNSNIQS